MIHYIFFLQNFSLVSQALAARNYQPSLFKTFYFNNNFFIITSLFFFFYRVRVHRSQALVSFKKYMPPPLSSLLQGKHIIVPFTPSPLRLTIFRLFVILSLTQLYRYTPEIFLFSTATSKYKYRAPLRLIGQEYSAKVAFSIFQSMKRIQSLPVRSKLI
jgi:hypothetical protein